MRYAPEKAAYHHPACMGITVAPSSFPNGELPAMVSRMKGRTEKEAFAGRIAQRPSVY